MIYWIFWRCQGLLNGRKTSCLGAWGIVTLCPLKSLLSTGIELCFPSDVLVHGFIALPSALFEVSVHVLTHLRELRQAKMLAKVS